MPGSPAPQKGMKTVKPAGLTIAAISGFGPDRGAIPARTTDRGSLMNAIAAAIRRPPPIENDPAA